MGRGARLWFCSTGHATPGAAMDAYLAEESNPGGTTIVRQDEAGAAEEVARYAVLAVEFAARRTLGGCSACP
ncbi:hypothetical protein ACIG3E_32585 [Streptomyces sp. NPDC053474]|uniref:hypothetical protein n=1 Tax=Streptomyces sp. NPDC053474 TaxID=3365704 RepID=UPI0037D855C0